MKRRMFLSLMGGAPFAAKQAATAAAGAPVTAGVIGEAAMKAAGVSAIGYAHLHVPPAERDGL